MGNRKRPRYRLLAAAGAGLLFLSSLPFWAMDVARRIAWLDVQRVEVSGARLLAPHEVLHASGIVKGQHLLDDRAVWEQALLEHPVIAGARISRRLPNTLRIRIEEKRPVAFVSDGTLRLATAAGEILPVEPHTVPLDLPIVVGTLSDSARAIVTRRVLAETDRLTALDPTFMLDVSDIRVSATDENVLVLNHRAAEILIPIGATTSRLNELRRVLSDVERRFPSGDGATPLVKHRLDLRFGDQVVVRPSSLRELS